MDMTKGFHVLEKSVDTPPGLGRGERYVDPEGNEFELVFHQTPTLGVAIDAGGPVGYLAGLDDEIVTGDITASDDKRVAGASMVAISIAESFAGIWHWVLKRGSMLKYKTGGSEVPIGASGVAFRYETTYLPIDTIPYQAAGTVLNQHVFWSGDNEWDDDAVKGDKTYAGITLTTEASATPVAEIVRFAVEN